MVEESSFQPIITLYDAITDSPVFRSSLSHYDQQLDQLEHWLDSFSRQLRVYTDKLNKLNVETMTLCQKAIPEGIDDTLIDPNFSGAVMKGFADALQTSLSFKTKLVLHLEESLISPLQQFVKTHLKDFKGFRKQYEKVLEKYDTQLAKYSSINKTKDPSSIREAAFRLHEARKEYVRMSGQHVLRILNFRSMLERLLIERFSRATMAQKRFYDEIQIWTNLDAALSYWKQWLVDDKLTCSYQLYEQQLARKRLEDEFIQLTIPDRDIEKYVPMTTEKKGDRLTYSTWGYLFIKTSRHSWTRKWFYVHGGYFGSCQADKKTIISEIRVRLTDCKVQASVDLDRRFCFEVKATNQPSFILQAETEESMQRWIQVFHQNKQSIEQTPSVQQHHVQDVTLLQDASMAMVSTTPDIKATLANSSSLTPLLVWEAARGGSCSIQQLPSGSWGIPWSLVPTMVNLTEDNIVEKQVNLPQVVWPAKTASVEVPHVDMNGYTDKMNGLNRELRHLFSGVGTDEVVLDVFVCCLRKKPKTLRRDHIKDIQQSKSTLNSPSADLYENELVHQLVQLDNLSPLSSYGYAYTGRGFITQDTFWFYSCILMTCINSVAIRLKDIEEIKVIKDPSIHRPMHDTTIAMKTDMVISVSLVSNAQCGMKEPLIFGFLMDDIEVIASNLTLAVENAKSNKPLPIKDLFSKMQQLSLHLASHKSIVLNVPVTFSSAISQIKENHLTRTHAATVGPESQVNASEILKSARQRGDSEPLPQVIPPEMSIELPKPDPDMPPADIQCPEGPVQCNCEDHLDRQDAQLNLPISAKRCFELLFSDEQTAPPTNGGVWESKTAAIEGHDLSVTPWSKTNGELQRVLKYWMPVSNPIVRMKEAEVVETQVLINKEDYIRYTVQISTKTAALPYADAFIPSVRYCITWVNKSECQLTCYLGVHWVKSVLVRAIVTRAALKGMSDSVQVFMPILEEASEKIKAAVDQEHQQGLEHNNSLFANQHEAGNKPSMSSLTEEKIAPEPVSTPQPNRIKSIPSITHLNPTERTTPSPSVSLIQHEKPTQTTLKTTHRFSSCHWPVKDMCLFSVLLILSLFTLYSYSQSSTIVKQISRDKFGCPLLPVALSKSRSVYLRDIHNGLLSNNMQPPYAQTRSFQVFMDLKSNISFDEDYITSRYWHDLGHYRLAVDLYSSREKLGVLRHDILLLFQALNRIFG
ncbi:SNF1-interacting protein [Rhizopus stolonifer]|uniref:SNF1-interacting protein n=1 Tax=Rhizopus stolonifer TaxID=4846 RepID=A0A367KTH9_RHIST|nr:SNF1-interacting protein [Rhizopus stolonifer]